MKFLSERYIGVGFYRTMGGRKQYPLESALEVNTNSITCKITGYWHRQSGMPKQTVDVSLLVTDSEEIKSTTIRYFNEKLRGTILSVNGNVTGLFKSSNKKEILSVSLLEINDGIGINGILDREEQIYFINLRLFTKDPANVNTNVVELGKHA